MADATSSHDLPVSVTQLGYIGIGVSDMVAWHDYAQAVLGFQVNGESGAGETFLRIDEYHHRFILAPGGNDDIAFHGWEVRDAEALEQMASKLRAYGIEVTDGTAEETERRKVRRLIRFIDPDGLQTEIYFGPLIDHRPFISPRGVKGFNAGTLGLGHVVLAVKEPQSYIRFLTEVMGAKLSDYIDIKAGDRTLTLTFLHVNERHHSIAVSGQVQPPGAAAPKRINHVMVEARDIDDVGLTFSLVQQRSIMTGDLGRHTNDRMFSFYSQTPSGFMIEYGYGGLLIENESDWEVCMYDAPSIWGHRRPQQRPAPTPAKA